MSLLIWAESVEEKSSAGSYSKMNELKICTGIGTAPITNQRRFWWIIKTDLATQQQQQTQFLQRWWILVESCWLCLHRRYLWLGCPPQEGCRGPTAERGGRFLRLDLLDHDPLTASTQKHWVSQMRKLEEQETNLWTRLIKCGEKNTTSNSSCLFQH